MATKKQKPSEEEIQRLNIAECFLYFEIIAICGVGLIHTVLLSTLSSSPPFWPLLTCSLIQLPKLFLGPIDSWNQTFLPYFRGFWDKLGKQTTNFLVQRCLAAISILLLFGDISVVGTPLLIVHLVAATVMYCLLYLDFDEDIDYSGVAYEDTASTYGNDEKISAEGDTDQSDNGFELISQEEEEYQILKEKLMDLGDEFIEFIQKYMKSSTKKHLSRNSSMQTYNCRKKVWHGE